MKALRILGLSLSVGAGLAVAATGAIADGYRGSIKDAPYRFSWTGCYIGVNAGASRENVDVSWVANPVGYPISGPAVNAAANGSLSDTGFSFGVQGGCNKQWQHLVFGIEGDLSRLDLSDSRVVAVSGGGFSFVNLQEASIDWLATLRGRLGIAFHPGGPFVGGMVYGTGGLAWGNVHFRDREDHATTVLFGGATFNDVSFDKTTRPRPAGSRAVVSNSHLPAVPQESPPGCSGPNSCMPILVT
jgi:hypothetical protein